MTSLADRTIAALRTEHDTLAAIAATLSDEQLTARSGASEWSVAQVLSHLGSGAEMMHNQLLALLGRREPGEDPQAVWARWDSLGPQDQRAGFLEHDAALVAELEALDGAQRESLRVPLPFTPDPLSCDAFAGLRLQETALHGWDVSVALDPAAGLLTESAGLVAEQLVGPLGFLLGFVGKADRLDEPVLLDIGDSGYGVSVDDTVAMMTPVEQATASFTGPLEAAIRMVGGRLRPEYTPDTVTVSGNVTLDELRQVFPGF